MMKASPAWSWRNNNNSPVTPDILDINGYPTSIVNTGVVTNFYVPSQLARPGNYVITWDGTGTIFCGMNNTLVSGSKTSSGGVGAGRYVFSTTDSNFIVGISAIGSPIITNIQVFHADDEPLLLAGQVFGVKFKQRIAQAKFGVLRFLNWQAGNTTNMSSWSERKSVNYFSYGSIDYRPDYYGGVTSASGAAYTVSAPSAWSVLADKVKVIAKINASSSASVSAAVSSGVNTILTIATGDPNATFNSVGETVTISGVTGTWAGLNGTRTVTAASTGSVTVNFDSSALTPGALAGTVLVFHAAVTLNVGSTGAINVLNFQCNALSPSTHLIGGTSQSLACFVYDATLNAWIKQGGDTTALTPGGLINGAPIELMVRLCNEVGAHPYFVMPPFALTPMTDFVPSLATYCQANCASWSIPRFEGPNETWNTISVVPASYANAIANAYGWGSDFQNWYGKVMSTIGQAVNAVYGGTVSTQTKYQVLCGVQTAGGTGAQNPRLSSAKYILQSPQSGYTATAASGWVTHVCCAQYYNPTLQGTGTETTLAAAYAGVNFTASIAGTALTRTGSQTGGPLTSGFTITGVGVNGGILTTGTQTNGGTEPNFTVNNSQTVASQFMTGGVDLTAPITYVQSCGGAASSNNLAAVAALYSGWKTWAKGFGVNKMCGYEGGYSPDFAASGNSATDRLKAASKLASDLVAFTTTNYNNFVGLTDGTFTSEFPSCFTFGGSINNAGYDQQVWSVLVDLYQTPDPPQWTGIVAFNA